MKVPQRLKVSKVKLNWVRRLVRQERYARALSALEQMPHTPPTNLLRAQCLLGVNRHDEALALFQAEMAKSTFAQQHAIYALYAVVGYVRTGQNDIVEQVLDQCRRDLRHPKGQLYCEYLRAVLLCNTAQLDAGIALCRSLMRMTQQRYQLLHVLVATLLMSTYRSTGKYAECRDLFKQVWPKALRVRLHYRIGILAYERATMARETGKALDSQRYSGLAESYLTKSGAPLLQADLYTFQASLASDNGELERALSLHALARQSYAAVGYRDGESLCAYNIANLHSQLGDFAAALFHFTEAHRLAQNQRSTRLANLGLGYAYRLVGNGARAQGYLMQALDLFEVAQDWAMASIATAELALVVPSAERAQLRERAIGFLAQGEVSTHQIFGLQVICELLMRDGLHAEAHDRLLVCLALHRTLASTIQSTSCELLLIECELELGRAQSLSDTNTRLQALAEQAQGLAEFQARIAQLQARVAGKANDLALALRYILQAARHWAIVRAVSVDPVFSGYLAQVTGRIFVEGLKLAHYLGNFDAIIELAQLRRLNWVTRSTNRQTDSQDVDEQLSALVGEMRALRRQMRPTTALSARHEAGTKLHRLNEIYERLDHSLQASGRSAEHGSASAAPQSLAHLREVFGQRYRSDWTLIQIEPLSSEGELPRRWLMLMIDAHRQDARELVATPIIEMCLRHLTEGDARNIDAAYSTHSAQTQPMLARLAKWLQVDGWVGSERDRADRVHQLFISDSEPFRRLAYAALPCRGQRLAEQASIVFLQTWPQLQARLAGVAVNNDLRVLFVAPGGFADESLRQLPMSAEEVGRSSALLPNSELLSGPRATLVNLRGIARRGELDCFDVIYFATHLTFDAERPRLSGIALTDGDLTVQEILNWRLSAQLVCVSGCAGAQAWTGGGEEHLGVETALLSVGAGEVVNCIWPVRDRAAADFVVAFLSRYVAGQGASVALAGTTQSFLQADKPASMWAGWRVSW